MSDSENRNDRQPAPIPPAVGFLTAPYFYILPPAAREPFYKKVPWTLPKFFIIVGCFIILFSSRSFAVKKIGSEFRKRNLFDNK
jgi:tellurite resistance protein TehA-like permease